MHNLKFDVEAAKEQLTRVFRDRLSAQGSVFNVQNVDIEGVTFEELQEKIAGQDAAVAAMQAALTHARKDGIHWFNDVQPHLTEIPQAAIDYAARWNETIPWIRKMFGQQVPDRAALRSLLGGLKEQIAGEIATLGALKASLDDVRASAAADAEKFSAHYEPFQQLESLDRENLEAARAAIARLTARIAELNEEIDVDVIKTEKDLAIASNALKAGSKGGNVGKATGVTVSVIFLVSASRAIDDLVNAVHERFAAAQQSAEFDVELSSLTAQLIALETASGALATLVGELDDLRDSLGATLRGWQEDADHLAAILAALDGDAPLPEILDPFDLGVAQGQWDELRAFATSWQSVEIAVRATNELVFDDTPAPAQPAAFTLHPILAP